MSEPLKNSEHDQVALLLPWYVNNSLSSTEQARVDLHIVGCDLCRENISVLSKVHTTLQHCAPTPIVPQPRVDELLGKLDEKDKWRDKRRWMTGLFVAASIAAFAIVTPLLLTVEEKTSEFPGGFVTATSSAPAGVMDYVLAVRFETTTLPADRRRVMQDIQARDISGDDEVAWYRMTVRLPAASLEELERYTLSIRVLSEVQSVQVVAVQLPMRHDP